MLKNVFVIFGLLASFSMAQAQASKCNQAVNPHSFACGEDTFLGRVFPFFQMNPQVVLGPWKLFTYSPVNDVAGPEFAVLTNPNNPRIPEGVVNRLDNSPVGSLEWDAGNVRMLNWTRRGLTITQLPKGVLFRDKTMVEVHFVGDGKTQVFQCRLFNRKNTAHLLCRWMTREPQGFVARGFLGFLRGR